MKSYIRNFGITPSPFGLQMAGISSKAALSSLSAYKYNAGSELEDEGGLNYYNTFYRKYDAQIGRFTGVDILAEKVFNQSTFQYGSNNPIFYNDPSGALNDWLDDAPAWLATLWNNVLDGHDVHFTPTMSFGGGYGGGENGDGGIVFSASEMSNMHSGTSHGQSGFWFTYSYTQGPLASTAWTRTIIQRVTLQLTSRIWFFSKRLFQMQ